MHWMIVLDIIGTAHLCNARQVSSQCDDEYSLIGKRKSKIMLELKSLG